MKSLTIAVSLLLLCHHLKGQESSSSKLKVFIDCSNTNCDYNYIRTEINIVDFLLDRVAADVHVLITSRQAGNGGEQYQIIFYGQGRFTTSRDTLTVQTDPNATDFERREAMVRYMGMGLTPFIAKTSQASSIDLSLKANLANDSVSNEPTRDRWNYWVYRLGADGNINTDQNYTNGSYGAWTQINRTTDQLKVNIYAESYTNFSESIVRNDSLGDKKVTVKNSNYTINHQLTKSINDHWSYGYETRLTRNSFFNNKNRYILRAALEYDIFPYSEVNTKFLTINYGIEARYNQYFETTLYGEDKETLFRQSFRISASMNQKWGTLGMGVMYRNYLHNMKYQNLGLNVGAEVRITGGLSFYAYMNGNIVRDQLYLPNDDLSEAAVLSRQRQLASGYNFNSNVGFNYRFGSKLNNFVNQRFTGRGNNFRDD